jgi:tryptophan-rich sensory protein
VGGIASKGQLRWAFWRWAIVTVPLVLLLGFWSGNLAPSGNENAWYAALAKPALTPPGWLFPVAWTTLYTLLGLAVAIVLNARGARWRWPAVAMFATEIAALMVWSPLFFGAHKVLAAFGLICFLVLWGIATTVIFGRVRPLAAWLMVPFLVWISFAAMLNLGIHRLNPDAEAVAPGGRTTQML